MLLTSCCPLVDNAPSRGLQIFSGDANRRSAKLVEGVKSQTGSSSISSSSVVGSTAADWAILVAVRVLSRLKSEQRINHWRNKRLTQLVAHNNGTGVVVRSHISHLLRVAFGGSRHHFTLKTRSKATSSAGRKSPFILTEMLVST